MKATITQRTEGTGSNIYIENVNILCSAEAVELSKALKRAEDRNELLLKLLYRLIGVEHEGKPQHSKMNTLLTLK